MGSTRRNIAAALLIAAALGGGCARTGTASPATDPPAPMSPAMPTKTPKPPKTPSDLVPHDVIAGRVTAGGSGPCYRLVTDEGTEYALHSTAGIDLREGAYVRVKFTPLTADPHCGPGRPVALVTATVLG